MRNFAMIFSVLVCAPLAPGAFAEDPAKEPPKEVVRDAVRSGRYVLAPARQRPAAREARPSGDEYEYAAPSGARALGRAFWDTIYKLERNGYRNGRKELVQDIRDDLAKLGSTDGAAAMVAFLRISHHYHGSHDGRKPVEARELHRERFINEVRAFARSARRRLETREDPTALNLFANVRALATAGPAGLELSQELAAIDPDNAAVLRTLGQDLLNEGEMEEAIAASRRAIEIDPEDSVPHTTMASAKYAIKDYAGAHAAAAAALRVDPGDKIAFSIKKLTQSRMPAPEEESKPAAQGPSDPEDEPAEGGSAGREAATTLIAAASLRDSIRLADQSRMELNKGDFTRAALLATRAIEMNPGNASALFRRAVANMRQEKLEEAFADTTAAMRVMGDRSPPLLLMTHAKVLNKLRRYTEALDFADRGLSGSPAAPVVGAQLLFQKAWALAGIGRRQDSLHALAQAARLDDKYITYYQEALALPAGSELTSLLGSDIWIEAQNPAAGEPGQSPSRGRGERTMTLLLLTLVGGFLVATGLMHFMSKNQAAAGPVGGRPAAGWPGADDTMAPPEPGRIAGSYKVVRQIGRGGMGVVYEALDVNLERKVAIKRLRDEIAGDVRERERFLHEARTVAALRHQNIVEIYSVVGDSNEIYLVFEYVDGHTVTDYVNHYKRLQFGQALRVLQGTADALEFAHQHGVIHRDLKPSNIMINRAGVVKVMDFGVARQAKDSLSTMPTATITGTPPYMAPEQEEGIAVKPSDVFSMAVCFYEMVTGALPFTGTGVGIALSKRGKTYLPASLLAADLPEGIDPVMAWGLEPDPARRCPSPGRFFSALAALAGHQPTNAR